MGIMLRCFTELRISQNPYSIKSYNLRFRVNFSFQEHLFIVVSKIKICVGLCSFSINNERDNKI